jgi:hypothetical protein
VIAGQTLKFKMLSLQSCRNIISLMDVSFPTRWGHEAEGVSVEHFQTVYFRHRKYTKPRGLVLELVRIGTHRTGHEEGISQVTRE